MTPLDRGGPAAADAFGYTADPGAYVPRLALEAALAEIFEGVGKRPACTALTRESGLGKTLLLHVLQERLAGSFEALYVPFPRLSADELWRWVAAALGLGTGEDDRGAVLGRAQRLASDDSGLVLLVDDAGALPPSTRQALLSASSQPGFSLVLAFDSEDHTQLAALPNEVRRIDLGPPMTLAETRAYVHARLRRVDPEGAITTRLGMARLAEMHQAAGGVPARLHALLEAWLRGPEGDVSAADGGREPSPTVAHAKRPRRPLPEPARALLARLQEPRTQLLLAGLALALIAGLWTLAIERSSGVSSVGVPVERLDAVGGESP